MDGKDTVSTRFAPTKGELSIRSAFSARRLIMRRQISVVERLQSGRIEHIEGQRVIISEGLHVAQDRVCVL